MKYNFDELIDRSASRSAKYDERLKKFQKDDVIPLWIADMDFKTAQPIICLLYTSSYKIHGIKKQTECSACYYQWIKSSESSRRRS